MSGLDRFLKAQENEYQRFLTEIKNGNKISGEIYYIFPQIKGLGFTDKTKFYAIKNIEEAIDYLKNDILKSRLVEISQALLDLKENTDIKEIIAFPDDLKLKSSMTLFKIAEEKSDIDCNGIFQKVLDKFFNGEEDPNTSVILQKQEFDKDQGNESEENSDREKVILDEIIKENKEKNIDISTSKKTDVNIEEDLNKYKNNKYYNKNEKKDENKEFNRLISCAIETPGINNFLTDDYNNDYDLETEQESKCCNCNIM